MQLIDVEKIFKRAMETNKKFIATQMTVVNSPHREWVIIPAGNFERKLNDYKSRYSEDGELHALPAIKIVGCIACDGLEDLVKVFNKYQ